MRNLTKEFKNRKIIVSNLLPHGFIQKEIITNTFKVQITILNNTEVTSRVIENEKNDEYLLVDVSTANGEFVGRVKEEYDKVIEEFISTCTSRDVFKNKYTELVIKYIKDKYHDDLEFLWEKYDHNAIIRNKKNNKWYAVFLTINANKLGLSNNESIEILDLMYQKDSITKIIDYEKIFPGYRMNKKSWITIKLDGSISLEELYRLIDNSYNISISKKGEYNEKSKYI